MRTSSLTPTPKPRSMRSNVSRSNSSLPPSDVEPFLSMDVGVPESLGTQLMRDIIMNGAMETQEDSMILGMRRDTHLDPADI